MTPFFSIIIPTYNRANLLPTAINSVINQSFKNWELIIIDDGSTDETEKKVKAINDNRIQYFYQENQERSAARNNGVSIANGKYICFLDSDDFFMPDRFERLYNKILELKDPAPFMFTGVCFGKNGVISKCEENSLSFFPNKYDFFIHSHIHCQQTIILKEVLLKNKFNTKFNIAEDKELWMRIISENDFLYIEDEYTVVVTDHDDRSISVLKNNSYAKELVVFSYMRKQFNYPFSKETVRYMNTDCRLGIAKYYIYQKKRFKAFNNLLLSILYDIKNRQVKYKLNIAFSLFLNYKKALHLIK